MIIKPGHWLGRGTLLHERGSSTGTKIECDLRVEQDDDGMNVTGTVRVEGEGSQDLSVRIVENDVGTFTLDVRLGAAALAGTAKLASAPNLGLVWNEIHSCFASFALFTERDVRGCRGFARDGHSTCTWEIPFKLKQDVVGGKNVVSFKPRRR